MIEPLKSTSRITIIGVMPPLVGPLPSAENHEPIRLPMPGPLSQRLVSRSVPQIAQPAANGLTGSRQFGQRLRSGIAHRIARSAEIRNRTFVRIPGVENVWDYPRPPAVEPCTRRVRVELSGVVLADSEHALRVLETSHPPAIYVPPQHVHGLTPSRARSTWCEFKGVARYWDAGDARAVAWSYPDPSPGYEALRDHVSFYPGRVDAAYLDDERVLAQAGDFYGGWITADLAGPFKGAPGTLGW